MWKEAVVASFEVPPDIYLEGLKKTAQKTSENISRSVFGVFHGHLPNTIPKCYNLHQLAELKIAKCSRLVAKRRTDWPYKDAYFTLCLRRKSKDVHVPKHHGMKSHMNNGNKLGNIVSLGSINVSSTLQSL